eukprot:gene8251-biopygen78
MQEGCSELRDGAALAWMATTQWPDVWVATRRSANALWETRAQRQGAGQRGGQQGGRRPAQGLHHWRCWATTWWRRGGRVWRRTRSGAGPQSCRESDNTEHQTTMIHEQSTGKLQQFVGFGSAAQLVSFRSAAQIVSARSAAQLRSAMASPTAQRSCANCTPRSISTPRGASTARARSTPRQASYARAPSYSAGGAHRGGHLRARPGVPRYEALRCLIRVARGALTVRQPAVHGSPTAAPSRRRPTVVRRSAALLQQRLQRPSSLQCRAVSRSEWCGRHCGPPPALPRRRPRHACGGIRERQQPMKRPNKRMAEWMSTARLRRRGGGARQRRAQRAHKNLSRNKTNKSNKGRNRDGMAEC